MSRNLCQDTCPKCFRAFTLADFRGQPIEFRQYGRFVPVMGCKLVCTCGCVLFGWLRTDYKYWAQPDDAFKDTLGYADRHFPNTNKGKFAFMAGDRAHDAGYYQIDLSYYESYNDEGDGVDTPTPAHLFTGVDDPLTKWEQHRVPEET